MPKFTTKLVLYYEVPIEDLTNQKLVKEGYKLLAQQIMDHAKAVEKDPNVIIMDSVFITKDEDYKSRADSPVNVHLAELMAGRTAALTTKTKKKKEESDLPVSNSSTPATTPADDDEPPRVKAMSMAELAAAQAEKAKNDEPSPVIPPVTDKSAAIAAEDSQVVLDKIFENLKRTQKSVTILTAMAKAGKELTMDDLIKITGLEKNDVSSWLNQTGKSIKAVTKVKRGVYKLDPDKV